MRLKIFFAGLIAAAMFATVANAGPVYLQFVYDPATTAGDGIAPVNGMSINSTRSGAGNWHLYALDANAGSLGLAQYNIGITGSPLTVLHRSSQTQIDNGDGEFFSSGFTLLRAQAAGAAAFIQASQNLPDQTPFLVAGFGRTTGNFASNATAIDADSFVAGPTTSGQWGNYATDPSLPADPDAAGLNWLLLAEGTYEGNPGGLGIGTASTAVYYNGSFQTPAASQLQLISGGPPPNTAPDVIDAIVGPPYNNNDPGSLQHQFMANDAETPGCAGCTWDNLMLVSYTPNYGGAGTGPATDPTLSGSGLFDWNSAGSPRGDYVWSVRTTDPGGLSAEGTITVHANLVPEPASIALFGIAMVGGLGLIRRRNG
jgi:hypothetical protein